MHFPKSFELTTQRLKLRMPSLADIPHVFSATRHKGFNDGMQWGPPEKEEDLIPGVGRAAAAWEKGEGYSFSIYDKDSEDFLGRISIRKTETPDLWNVGFFTHPIHQGKGIMTEALGAVLELGFRQIGASKIEAAHAIWNKASAKVLTNNGMQFERYIEQGFKKRGEWVAENLLSITFETWEKIK